MKFFSSKNTSKTAADRDREYLLLGLRIMGEFGATIAVPVVLLAWLGEKLDRTYDTGPWLLISGFVLAFVLSAAVIYRRAKVYGREYEALGKEKTTINK